MIRLLLSALVFIALVSLPAGTTFAEGTLIAFYTLNQTTADQTSNNHDANIVNAPYEDGGVYLNGKYVGVDPDGSAVVLTNVFTLDFSALSVSVEFKISEWPTGSRPILYCGSSWRWMGAGLTPGGNVYLNYNSTNGPASTETVTPGVWHTLAMIYDGTTGHVILDGVEVAAREYALVHGNDRSFTTNNGGEGTAFKGHLRNLKIFNGVEESLPAELMRLGDVKALYR